MKSQKVRFICSKWKKISIEFCCGGEVAMLKKCIWEFHSSDWLKAGKRRTGIGFRRFQWEGWLEEVRSVERSGIIEKWTPSRSCKTGHKHTIVYFGSAWKSNLPIASCVGEKSLHRFQLISMGRNWMVYSNSKTHFLLGTWRKVTKSQMPTATFYRAFWILVVVVQHL